MRRNQSLRLESNGPGILPDTRRHIPSCFVYQSGPGTGPCQLEKSAPPMQKKRCESHRAAIFARIRRESDDFDLHQDGAIAELGSQVMQTNRRR